jgi:Superfamily II DNA/RNA helicases, SNF2 family
VTQRQNAVTRALSPAKPKQRDCDVWIEGRWVHYAPTFSPAPEVAEWGGRWDKKKQAYRLPRLTRILQKILQYDPDARFSGDAKRWADQEWEGKDKEVAQALSWSHENYQNLYPYQMTACKSLVTRPFHGEMLALSPGLGKTPTSIVAADQWVEEYGDSFRVCVVAPLSLLRNWEREILKWSGDPRVEVCHQEPPTDDRSVRWTVTNYDTIMERVKDQNTNRWSASGNLKEDWDLDWDVVIFDESVLLKNRKSKRVSAARTLARNAKRVWLLSGAPITRDNSDIFSQFQIMEPDYFTSFWRFANEFCVVVQTPWSQGTIMGSRHNIHVREEFPDLMFVRNQEQVLPDLPEYIFKDIELQLHPKQKKAHDDVITDWIHELEENRDKRVEVTAVIAMLIRLQQITSNLYNLETTGTPWPDYSSKADFVEEVLDEGEVEWPVLIWTHHRPGAKALHDRLTKRTKKKDSALFGRRVALVYGGTRGADQTIEDYKAGKIDVLILGIQVGKYGHTLVNTRTVITYDKTWDSDAWFQMLHRVRRNGLTHSPLVLNPRCRGTVDDFVELNLAGKLPAMASLTGAGLAGILRSLGEDRVV